MANTTMKTALTVAVLLSCCTNPLDGAGRMLPSFLKPCPKNDPKLNECAAANGNLAIPKLKNGIPAFGVPPLDPFYLKKIDVDSSNLGVSFKFTDVQLYGLSETKVKSIRIKHDPPYFQWNTYMPVMQMVGKYEASGRVLILPITGKGDFNFTMYGMDVQYDFNCDTVKKSDGELYYVPTTNKVDYSLTGINIFMDNLFNGNKLLGDEMNRFLNENWREVDQNVGPKVAQSIVFAMQSLMKSLTSKVPVKNFWIGK